MVVDSVWVDVWVMATVVLGVLEKLRLEEQVRVPTTEAVKLGEGGELKLPTKEAVNVGDDAGLKVTLAAGVKDRVKEGNKEGLWVSDCSVLLLQRGVRVTAKGDGDPVEEGDKLC